MHLEAAFREGSETLRDALRALGLIEQQLDLERTFGAMMGKDLSRSR